LCFIVLNSKSNTNYYIPIPSHCKKRKKEKKSIMGAWWLPG